MGMVDTLFHLKVLFVNRQLKWIFIWQVIQEESGRTHGYVSQRTAKHHIASSEHTRRNVEIRISTRHLENTWDMYT